MPSIDNIAEEYVERIWPLWIRSPYTYAGIREGTTTSLARISVRAGFAERAELDRSTLAARCTS